MKGPKRAIGIGIESHGPIKCGIVEKRSKYPQRKNSSKNSIKRQAY